MIDELIIKGVFDKATYKQKVEEVNTEIMVKTADWNEAKIEMNDIEACLNYCKQFIKNIASLWATADGNLKQRFQTLIFPDRITYNQDGTFGTTETALIFKQLQGKSPVLSTLVVYAVRRRPSLSQPTSFFYSDCIALIVAYWSIHTLSIALTDKPSQYHKIYLHCVASDPTPIIKAIYA